MQFKTTLLIKAHPDLLFRLLTDPRNLSKWQHGFKQYKPEKGRRRTPGHSGVLVFQDGEERTEVQEEVLAYQPGRLFTIRLRHRNMDSTVRYELRDQSEGATKLTARTQVRLKPFFFNLLGFFVKGPMRKQAREDLARLKGLVEEGKR